nr:hypothetical protein [Streptomyces sp. DSM 41633]
MHTSCVEALDAAIATTSTLYKLLVVSTNPTLFIVAAVATIVLVRRHHDVGRRAKDRPLQGIAAGKSRDRRLW